MIFESKILILKSEKCDPKLKSVTRSSKSWPCKLTGLDLKKPPLISSKMRLGLSFGKIHLNLKKSTLILKIATDILIKRKVLVSKKNQLNHQKVPLYRSHKKSHRDIERVLLIKKHKTPLSLNSTPLNRLNIRDYTFVSAFTKIRSNVHFQAYTIAIVHQNNKLPIYILQSHHTPSF